jgi:hypothetical protein
MVGVVEKGTGIAAQLNDVMVGGKTGTAQQLINGNYQSSKHNSSFVGFFRQTIRNDLFDRLMHLEVEIRRFGCGSHFHDVGKEFWKGFNYCAHRIKDSARLAFDG